MHRATWTLAAALVALALPGRAGAADLLGHESKLIPAVTPVEAPPEVRLTPEAHPGIGFGEHLAKTTAAGVFASTAGVLLAVPLGSLAIELVPAALPVLLSHLFVPPALTVLAAWLVGQVDAPGRYGYWGAFGVAFLVHAATFAVSALFFAVPWSNPVALLLYSLVDGLLMSGSSVGFMHLFPNRKQAAPTVASFVPGVGDTTFVPCTTVAF